MGGKFLQLLRLEALYDKAVALGNEVLAARSRGLKIWHVRCEVGRFRRSREPGLWGFLAALVNRRCEHHQCGPLARSRLGSLSLSAITCRALNQRSPRYYRATMSQVTKSQRQVRSQVCTNLMLGPNSKLKLDRAVSSGQKGLGDVAIKLTEGYFSFHNGKLEGRRSSSLCRKRSMRRSNQNWRYRRGYGEWVSQRHSAAAFVHVIVRFGLRWNVQSMTSAQAENSLTTGSIDGGRAVRRVAVVVVVVAPAMPLRSVAASKPRKNRKLGSRARF